MLATAMYLMWGTPFIYNGEEIGMTNPEFKSVEDFRDAPTIARYHDFINSEHMNPQEALKKLSLSTRDNARCIMSWENAENAGFSRVRPWAITGDYQKHNVADEKHDPDSVLTYYKKLIWLRKNSPYRDIIIDGTYEQVYRSDAKIYGYIRKFQDCALLVLCNFSNETVKVDHFPYSIKKIVLSNYQKSTFTKGLLPFEAVVLEINSEETSKHES
jgi:glycosidase